MICRIGKLLVVVLICTCLAKSLPLYAGAETVSIHMDVGEFGQKTASFAVGEEHRWHIRTQLPEMPGDISGITVLQTLSPALTLDTESVGVKLLQKNGEQILLRMEEHYDLSAGSVFVEEGVADRLCISLTQEGMAFLAGYQEPNAELMVSYRAKINTFAKMGTQILGTAQLNLTDAQGRRQIYLSDKAVASTGGFHILLTDPQGEPLEGERFMLAREAKPEELEAPSVEKELLDTGMETIAVIYEQFYTTENLIEGKTDIAVTGINGEALCYGLAYGTYYLVQMESYRDDLLTSRSVKVQVNESSHLTVDDGWTDGKGAVADNTVRVTASRLVMPQTGGCGTVPYTLSGTLVILCACLLLWYNRKRSSIL